MSYDIVKGWPSVGALDERLTPAVGVEIKGGQVVELAADGTCAPASVGATPGILAFTIDNDTITGGFLGLMNKCIIECDADHYAAGSYSASEAVTAVDGKFSKITTDEAPVARVISFDAVTGKMRLLWTA